jgi:hypothetical protein
MKPNYIDDYAKRFKLQTDGQTCWNSSGEIILEIIDAYVRYKDEKNEWRMCKQGDLFMCLFNDTPLHQEQQTTAKS